MLVDAIVFHCHGTNDIVRQHGVDVVVGDVIIRLCTVVVYLAVLLKRQSLWLAMPL